MQIFSRRSDRAQISIMAALPSDPRLKTVPVQPARSGNDHTAHWLFAEQRGVVIGAICYSQRHDALLNELSAIWVRDDLRRNGIGQMLLTHVIAAARQHGKGVVAACPKNDETLPRALIKRGFVRSRLRGNTRLFILPPSAE